MKKLILPLLAVAFLLGCSNDELSTTRITPNPAQIAQPSTLMKPMTEDGVKATEEFNRIITAHRARLARFASSKKGCKSTIQVPSDFATIQEAVDNACEGTVIIVKAGTYTEVVVVDKPGIKLKANGAVTLNGGFVLNEGADDVTIQQFSIVVGSGVVIGINAVNVSGSKIIQNTISDPIQWQGFAVRFRNGNYVTVQGNTISGTGWGVFFGTSENGKSNNNTISDNYITGMTVASVIGFQGDCDNNLIIGNTLVDNPANNNAGVMFYSGAPNIGVFGFCDNNIVKNNTTNNCFIGTLIFGGGVNNKIGPNNTFNNNRNYGIAIEGPATGNVIFNNTAQGNGTCDIYNNATNLLGNTFKINNTDCTINL